MVKEEEKINFIPKFSFQKTGDPKYSKTLDSSLTLMGILEGGIVMFWEPSNFKPYFQYCEVMKNQDSFAYKIVENSIIIAIGSKTGDSQFWICKDNKASLAASFSNHTYHISSIAFSLAKEFPLLCATSSHDRKIIIYEIYLDSNEKNGIKISPRIVLKYLFGFTITCCRHKNKVEHIKWSINNFLLAVATQDKTVQVWNCNITDEDRKGYTEVEKNRPREICNVRGHDGYITDAVFSLNDANIIITASDDQTVKVWDMNSILNKTLANKKKKNKKKKSKQGENIKKVGDGDMEEEQGDSGEEGEEEENEK